MNRLHEAKRYGVLVDYRGILKELDTAVRAYQDLEARTQGNYERQISRAFITSSARSTNGRPACTRRYGPSLPR